MQMGKKLPRNSPLVFPRRPNEQSSCWQSTMKHVLNSTISHLLHYWRYCHLVLISGLGFHLLSVLNHAKCLGKSGEISFKLTF